MDEEVLWTQVQDVIKDALKGDYSQQFNVMVPRSPTHTIIHYSPLLQKLSCSNCHPLELVSPYRETQVQVGEKYSYLLIVRPHI